MVRKKIFCAGPNRAAKAGKNLFYQHDKPSNPTKEVSLLFVRFESPFTSVSTVSRCHIVSLRMSLSSVRHDRMYIFPEYADPAAPHSPQYPENLMLCFNMNAKYLWYSLLQYVQCSIFVN
jgi:hypothetical protein